MIYIGNQLVNIRSSVLSSIEKDVNFYDYDGTLLYSYTKTEALELTALPPLPDRTAENLTNEGWNWTLSEMKYQMTNMGGKLYIGCTYHTTDDCMYLYITVYESSPDIVICVTPSLANDTTIYWGDGTSDIIETAAQTSVTHTYNTTSKTDYEIKVAAESGSFSVPTYIQSAETIGRVINSVKLPSGISLGNYAFSTLYALDRINIPQNVNLGTSCFYYTKNIKTLIFPRTITSIPISTAAFSSGKLISLPPTITYISNFAFRYCYQRVKMSLPYSLTSCGQNIIAYSYSFDELRFGPSVSSIGSEVCNTSSAVIELYCFNTTPPTIQSTTLGGYLKVIYVPSSAVNTYKTATNWSNYASLIKSMPTNLD